VGIPREPAHTGCSAAKTIVAINTDRDAAIFSTRYGIVGDCREIVPELIRRRVALRRSTDEPGRD
jgi:electron transfer flavoprotein alpha subunit